MENITKGLIDFLNKSHSEYNATNNIKTILLNEGFIELHESEDFNLKLGNNYFLIRNDNSVIAFKIANKLNDYHYLISASHSDSPSLKIKMCDDVVSNNYHKVAVEVYGGLIYSSYLDKPLSLAGRVVIKDENSLQSKIIDIDKNLMIIPNLCIHFNRDINKGSEYNPQTDLMPIISNNVELKNSVKTALIKELKISEKDIISYDLYLYNRDKATIGGLNDEFIMSPKIDNLESAYLSLLGFINANSENHISVYCLFDNEEVGSSTPSGADSNFLESTLKRINNSLKFKEDDYFKALAKSFILSIDNAHAVHPNHPEVSDPNNLVYLNKGIVIKFNSNMNYTSDSFSVSPIKMLCEKNNIPYQYFYNKSDVRGGSTLGAISATHLSITSLDIGLAQLAMHSNYEVAGAIDPDYMFRLVKVFYESTILINGNSIKL